MTSRSYSKSSNRKVITPNSTQFEVLRENSNRPSAAKSAVAGRKWENGKVSFTSIRSTNINGRRDDIHGTFCAKKMKLDYGNQNRLNSRKDPFSFETDSDNKDTAPAVLKPKKFFKSRNIPPVAEESHKDAATLRKSATDSNNTLISHYDIVKTDCGSTYSPKSTIEPLIGRDRPLPTTTQESIDILSSGCDTKPAPAAVPALAVAVPTPAATVPVPAPTSTPTTAVPVSARAPVSTLAPLSVNTNTENNLETAELDNVTNQVQHCSVDISTTEVATAEPAAIEQQDEPEAEPDSESEEPEPATAPRTSVDVMSEAAVKTLLDQDWFSSSDDTESTGGNAENEIPMLVTSSLVSESQAVDPPSTSAPTSVKPATKKSDIFKSRSTDATNGSKRWALYEWCDSDEESTTAYTPTTSNNTPTTASGSSNIKPTVYEEEMDSLDSTRGLTTVLTYQANAVFPDEKDMIKVRCSKKATKFYPGAKNVRKAHRRQESGEFQKFNDDVEYILDTLRENNPNATRCLSAIRLASKCMAPAFRMHVRAHGTVAKFFKALHDATKDQSLGLCTATVMFVLSQDGLTMDLDRDCLELILSLLESDASQKDALDDCGLSYAELLKNKEKVRQLCVDIQAQGHAKHLNLDDITVGQLAMETFLNLTSNRAGEWFQEELRELGGLERLVKTIREYHRHINSQNILRSGWKDPLLDKLRKVDRCLRVLENVTMNDENQMYLLKYEEGVLVTTLASLYHLCGREILIYPTTDPSDQSSVGVVIRECLLAITGVLVDLTHQFNGQSFGSKAVGAEVDLMDCSLFLLLRVPESIPEEKRYAMIMLPLLLLVNLVEQCDDNKKLLMELEVPPSSEEMFEVRRNGVDVLIDLFYEQEELARAEEQEANAILNGKKDIEQTEAVWITAMCQEEFIEETLTKLWRQKTGRHIDHTLIGGHVVLVLGYLVMDNMEYELSIRNRLPDKNFTTMISGLQKFLKFLTLAPSCEMSVWGIPLTEKLIKFLKLSDARVKKKNVHCQHLTTPV